MDSVTPDGPRRAAIRWHVATVRHARAESPTARTLVLDVPAWPGHFAGQHFDVRLTAEEGYQAAALLLDRLGSMRSRSPDQGSRLVVTWLVESRRSRAAVR